MIVTLSPHHVKAAENLAREAPGGPGFDIVLATESVTAEERERMRADVPRLGLKAPYRNGTVLDLARETVAIARSGLKARARLEPNGKDETQYIDTLMEIVAQGRTPAEELLEKFDGPWAGSVDPVYAEYSY